MTNCKCPDRKPLFTSTYCPKCEDVRHPQLQLPIPEYEPLPAPTKQPSTHDEIDVNNCITPYSVVTVCDQLSVANYSDISMFYRVDIINAGIKVGLWCANTIAISDILNDKVRAVQFTATIRNPMYTITDCKVDDNVATITIR